MLEADSLLSLSSSEKVSVKQTAMYHLFRDRKNIY